jgi:16S rRNA (guanine527-N7)-methyltransferase
MDTRSIALLLEPFLERPLDEFQLNQISIYIDLLLRWNARINLTAIRKEEEIVTRHFGESLFLARHLFPAEDPTLTREGGLPRLRSTGNVRVLDIGSGAGFPALPIKIWCPGIHLALIESNHKKTTFLREVARALRLTDIDIMADRAETIADRAEPKQADVVTLRAVERFEAILPQAVSFLAPKGRLALLITTAQIPFLIAGTTLHWHPAINVPQSRARVVVIGDKVRSGK